MERTMNDHPIKLIQKHLYVDEIQVDERYQRPIKPNQIRWIINHYDEVAFGRLLVAMRVVKARKGTEYDQETYWVIDGQQRLNAAKALGMKKVSCLVFESHGIDHEAKVFKQINTNRTAVRAVEVFKADLTANDETAVAINNVVRSCGFSIGNGGLNKPWYEVASVVALTSLYKRGGPDLLKDTLTLLKDVWDGERGCTNNFVIRGVATFMVRMEGKYDRKRLVNKLTKHTPESIVRLISDYRKILGGNSTAPVAVAEVICSIYNKGVKKGRISLHEEIMNSDEEE